MSLRTAPRQQWQNASISALEQLDEPLLRAYKILVSSRTGVIGYLEELNHGTSSNLLHQFVALVQNKVTADGVQEIEENWRKGAGAGLSIQEAMIAAIGEAIERNSACLFNDAEDIVWASYNQVRERAVCPTQFALPLEDEYQLYPDQLARFDPDGAMDWAQGWSLSDGSPVLVPAAFVHCIIQNSPPPSMWLSPGISTGLAVGQDKIAAVMRGLCECIERDAFMITYLNRLPVAEIDLEEVTAPAVRDLLSRIRPWSNYRIRAWNTTTDIGVASVLAAVTGSHETLPNFVCGSSTHVNPVQALRKALLEALQAYSWLADPKAFTEEERSRQYASDYRNVQTRMDHLSLSTRPAYRKHIAWLLSEREKISLARLPDLSGGTPRQELARVLAAVRRAGLPVVAYDLTTYEAQQAGLHACRILIPGTQPLIFGPIKVRSERVYSVPQRLGYTSEPTTEASLNPVPHPFP